MTTQQENKADGIIKVKYLAVGSLAMILCMVADWLLDMKGAGNITVGVVESNWKDMPVWRFETSILLISVIMPFYWCGIREMKELVGRVHDKTVKADRCMNRLFSVSAMAGVISFLFIHVVCCFLPVIYKCFYDAVPDMAQLTALVNKAAGYVMVPFAGYLFVADVDISLAFIYFVWRQRIAVPRIAVLCNPLVTGAFESLGYVLLLACGYWHCRKKKINTFYMKWTVFSAFFDGANLIYTA